MEREKGEGEGEGDMGNRDGKEERETEIGEVAGGKAEG